MSKFRDLVDSLSEAEWDMVRGFVRDQVRYLRATEEIPDSEPEEWLDKGPEPTETDDIEQAVSYEMPRADGEYLRMECVKLTGGDVAKAQAIFEYVRNGSLPF